MRARNGDVVSPFRDWHLIVEALIYLACGTHGAQDGKCPRLTRNCPCTCAFLRRWGCSLLWWARPPWLPRRGRRRRSGAAADGPKAVVELFTSQGCSSCPEADALLGRLAARDDVLALSFPVDYWDYLGWKDTLANPKFSERQKSYKSPLGVQMVYTPMMVVNGLTHVNGSDEDKVQTAIEKSTRIAGRDAGSAAHRREGQPPRHRGRGGTAGRVGQGSHALAGADLQERAGPDHARREPRQDHHLLTTSCAS